MKIEKVKFRDGTYGIRKTTGWIFKEYVFRDLVNSKFWWPLSSQWFVHCKTDDLHKIHRLFGNDIGVVVDTNRIN